MLHFQLVATISFLLLLELLMLDVVVAVSSSQVSAGVEGVGEDRTKVSVEIKKDAMTTTMTEKILQERKEIIALENRGKPKIMTPVVREVE